MSAPSLPPGWPPEVRPPGAPGWERTASAWLLDLCPPDYRAYPVLRTHPVALARLAVQHLLAQREGNRRALATARTDLADALDARTTAAVLEVLDREGARLLAAHRAAYLVERALRGERYVPRL